MRLLTARDYSCARICEKLCLKGVDAEEASKIVDELVAQGWLNDRRYAENYALQAQLSGRYFGQRLKMEMRRKGLSVELIAEVLARLEPERDSSADVRNVLEKRFPGFSYSMADEREKRRVLGFLQRKGFSLSVIFRVLKGYNGD